MPSPLVEILTIGTELILGRVADTNSQWLAQQVVRLGGHLHRVTIVRDDPDDIIRALSDGIARGATHILTTGGLGPTPDDLTVEAVARLIGRQTVVDEGLVRHFMERLRLAGREQVTPHMLKVATVPEETLALPNHAGWGHCIIVSHAGVTICILPGPPHEVQALFSQYIEPLLRVFPNPES